MRKIQQWAESACIQEEKGKRIKRWRRGNNLIWDSNPKKWLGQELSEPIELKHLEGENNTRIDTLTEKRDELNERK